MKCFFKSELCGTHKRFRQTQSSLVNDLDVSCKEYLISFKLVHCYDKDPEVSENRCDMDFNSNNYICAYHRCSISGAY